jgi:hypothetical protein
MSNTAFVLGNGESRKGIKIADLKQHGTVFACNGVYRTEEPDYLIAVDPKMILEIAETDYPKTHEVWSNYNHQYSKNETAKNHVRWFQPSLGWSSGPTALKMAADKKFTTIYILGFDYQGHPRDGSKKSFYFNNVFKDSRNYKKSKDEATYYGNWMNQTKRVLTDYPHIQFFRVVPPNAFKPHDLEFNKNFKHLDIDEFLRIHNIQRQS